MIFYIFSQVIEIIALVITLLAYHRKTKEKIFKQMMISNVLDMLHYLFLGAYSGFITKLIALIRNFVIVIKENNKKFNSNIILVLFIIVYIISGLFTYEKIYSFLPLLAAIIYMVVSWNGNELQVKKIGFLCYFLWLIYNITILSIFGIISNLIAIVSTYFAYHNMKRGIVND